MTAPTLGLLPLTVLWTFVCLGIGAWTMRALSQIRPRRTAPPAPIAKAVGPSSRMADYEAAVGRVLADGVISSEEGMALRDLRAAWGLSPADHVHAVARVQSKQRKDDEFERPIDS